MKPVKTISPTNSARISLGLHADLQVRLHAEIAKMPVAKILLDAADIANWKKSIDTENDVARRVMASEQTARLAEKDRERDKLVTAIFEEIRQAARSPIAARAESGRKLRLVTDTYKGLQWETVAEETAHITGLLTDLSKQQADVNALGIQPLVALLKTANTAFADLRTTRAQRKAADTLPTGAVIRTQNDETMAAVFRHIEAAYLTAADPDRKLVSDLIDRLNRIILETKTTHNESAAQKRAAAFSAGKKTGRETRKEAGNGGKPSDTAKHAARLAPGIPALERFLHLPSGSLTFTGRTEGSGEKRHYQLAVAGKTAPDGTPRTIWVGINKNGSLYTYEKTALKSALPSADTGSDG